MARKKSESAGYDDFRASQALLSRERSKQGREIGELPEVVNPERRARALDDSVFFYQTYFPNIFKLPFGRPHYQAIEELDYCMENGGQFALAFMRGGGKTALARAAAVKALCKGVRRYLVYIGATDPLATLALKSVYRQFECNDLLLEDFPEICYPIRCLERINQRCKGQTYMGVPTMMEITDGHIILPTIPGSQSSGSVMQSAGLMGAFKGLNITTASGELIRPDMVILDDCQTRESAKSVVQTDDRERIIIDDVMGLAGPETEIASVFLCTPIYVNDLSERFVDRERHPEWQGSRTKMIEQFPTNMAWWDKYAEVRKQGLRNGDHGEAANKLYEAEREIADAGCVLSWPDRKKEGKVSAIQSAMDLYLDNPVGFKSEYNCEPEAAVAGDGYKQIDGKAAIQRVNGLERGIVPPWATELTAFIDIGDNLLWYMVCGWNQYFGGAVVDYGTCPRQVANSFSKNAPKPGLNDLYPNQSPSQRVTTGLNMLIPEIAGRLWPKANGLDSMHVSRVLVDTGDGETLEAVTRSIQKFRVLNVIGSKGFAKSVSRGAVGQWKLRPNEKKGTNWVQTAGTSGKLSQINFDTNFWKTFVYSSMLIPQGGSTGIELFGTKPEEHELLGSHLSSEMSAPKNLDGYRWDQWAPITREFGKKNPDNDWFDCLVGCAVAASVAGVAINATGSVEPTAKAQPISLAKLQEEQRAKKDTKADTPADKKRLSLRELQEQQRRARR